jgi:alpha-L-fucosidase 2
MILSCLFWLGLAPSWAQSSSNSFWFDRPASLWTEALSVGNGRLGGLVYGRVQEERIKLSIFW